MRLAALALFFYAGTTVFCQSAAPVPASPDNLLQTPPVIALPPSNFNKFPRAWHATNVAPLKLFVPPNIGTGPRLGDARIDPKIIIHPPQSSLGVQPPGTPVAQNEFPNLRLLPIEWPRLQLQSIPTGWPKGEDRSRAAKRTGNAGAPD